MSPPPAVGATRELLGETGPGAAAKDPATPSTEPISPYLDLMRERLTADPQAHGREDTTGVITLLRR
ncbi:hypothetical protein ACFWCB_32450 [Streptomyces sp. NPDC060048]|uniref:hypothetical protein n=1 Tax=unclassified Streptomyces TaxID=2593676 RepID=UPI00367814CB